jgi:hypothetical protein
LPDVFHYSINISGGPISLRQGSGHIGQEDELERFSQLPMQLLITSHVLKMQI